MSLSPILLSYRFPSVLEISEQTKKQRLLIKYLETMDKSGDCDSDGSISWEDFFGKPPVLYLEPTQ